MYIFQCFHSFLLYVSAVVRAIVPTAMSVISDPLHPFNHPQDGPRARAFTPDSMEPDEMKHFPEFCKWEKALIFKNYLNWM